MAGTAEVILSVFLVASTPVRHAACRWAWGAPAVI